ncbi:ethanolamine utilization protein EutJ [Bacteriovorax stolpii]|uniref:Ethanolamine utilization protein EutJ n=1 Tax=Bacteriovorax stolpii TaxID=960 RepID=A0A2K9NRY3_BACTC|nr:ABC transporter substrate-binding protein [Bacteriovorax stolpii]AUN98280.1 ethanolamine utilization protein EutJ [Bacteriovorax stolpii]TDP52203.1 amino acid/amide ABC transporter substrate-binding protein (HAAT family) [Bacteriovorax stolpii]
MKMRSGPHRLLATSMFLLLTTSAFAADLKIGVVSPMTGATATFGQENANGIKLAYEKMKKMAGGKKFDLIIEDDKSEAIESTNATRKLLSVDKVSVMIGAPTSSLALASAPIVQEAKIPYITPTATNAKVTMVGDYITRACFTDDFQGVVMAKFAVETLKKTKGLVLVENTSDYSKGLAKSFTEAFTKLGGKMASTEELTYAAKDTDFQSLLRKVKRANPDFVFVPGYYVEVGLLLKQARAQGINVPFLGGDGWDSPKLFEIAGEAVKGSYISNHFAPDDKSPVVQNFVKDYEKAYGSKPGSFAALGYDSLGIVADAIKRAKSTKPADIRAALVATKGYQGITGTITFDKDRNPTKSAVVLEATPSGYVFHSRVNP